MAIGTLGTTGRLVLRLTLIGATLAGLLVIAASVLNLVRAFAVPFGFSAGTVTAISSVVIVFFASLAVLIGSYLFKRPDAG